MDGMACEEGRREVECQAMYYEIASIEERWQTLSRACNTSIAGSRKCGDHVAGHFTAYPEVQNTCELIKYSISIVSFDAHQLATYVRV
jgi:hypothetical protein